MFFDDPSEVKNIASKISCAIFVLKDLNLNISGALVLSPEEGKKTIGIEEVRSFTATTGARQDKDIFLIINPADILTEQAQNALLKNLEEPGEHYHYLLLTKNPGALLPTIRSRAHIYFEKILNPLEQPTTAGSKTATLARELITAKPYDLPVLADKIAKIKDNPRGKAIEIASTAIEILEKSYFKTGQTAYLTKLAKFINLADALRQNGHVKLHIVADLC